MEIKYRSVKGSSFWSKKREKKTLKMREVGHCSKSHVATKKQSKCINYGLALQAKEIALMKQAC